LAPSSTRATRPLATRRLPAAPPRWYVQLMPRQAIGLEPPFGARLMEQAAALYNFARYLSRDQSLAEELVQDAFARALDAQDHFVAGSNLKAWLFRILRNAFLDAKRRDRRNEFPMQGGAVGLFVDRKAATFVFKHRLHTATLFVFRSEGLGWPLRNDTSVGALPAASSASRGSNVLLWRNGDLGYALVSDVDRAELSRLAAKVAAP
jgi:anti-sigma factor RsiW